MIALRRSSCRPLDSQCSSAAAAVGGIVSAAVRSGQVDPREFTFCRGVKIMVTAMPLSVEEREQFLAEAHVAALSVLLVQGAAR